MMKKPMSIIRSHRKCCLKEMDINISVIKVLINISTTKDSMTSNIGLDYRKGKLNRVIIREIWGKK
ncbi:hypothetical protein L208DRAFT_430027 [Tricholoma matsutake]|nr:hypothetical protein L208DRAFT_430027 [Tricholoma matsutake 945]